MATGRALTIPTYIVDRNLQSQGIAHAILEASETMREVTALLTRAILPESTATASYLLSLGISLPPLAAFQSALAPMAHVTANMLQNQMSQLTELIESVKTQLPIPSPLVTLASAMPYITPIAADTTEVDDLKSQVSELDTEVKRLKDLNHQLTDSVRDLIQANRILAIGLEDEWTS